MKKLQTINGQVLILGVALILYLGTVITSCSSTSQISASKGGAQLWGENCLRCHNAPTPETFSDTEWDVMVTHMRVRANLTDEEAEKVVEWIKTAN